MDKSLKKQIIALLVGVLITITGYTQTELMISGRIQTPDNSVEGATVKLMHNFITIKKIVLDNTGTYTMYIPYGKDYSIIYEKKGYQPLQIDAILDLPKEVEQCCYRPMNISFHLFKPDSVNYELFQSAFHTIKYDKKYNGFIYDIDIDYMVQQRIVNAELFRQKVSTAKKGNEAASDSILTEKKYLALISQGTDYYNQKQFYAARKFFLEAQKMKPNRMYSTYKLEDIKTELQRFETKAELLGVNLDSLVARELASVQPIVEEKKPYPPFVPLTDAQVEEIFKRDLKKQILASSSNAAEANRTLALMNEFFKEDYKRVTAAEFKTGKEEPTVAVTTPPKDKMFFGSKPKQAEKPKEVAVVEKKPEVKQEVKKPVKQEAKQKEEPVEPIADFTAKPIKKEVVQQSNFVPKQVVDYTSYQDSLKQKYTEERTIEVTQDTHKKTTRVILNNGKVVEVYAMVEHSWGATYYFIEEYPSGAQSIGYSAFMNRTKLYNQQGLKPEENQSKDSIPVQK